MSLSTPVAFLIFRRPDLTQLVFNAIRLVKPKKLLVIADGPRTELEDEPCQQARAIIDTIDWDCEVLKNYSDINLGCKYRVSSGLDWVFSQNETAIILEDDCLPSQSFFTFCETLLKRYQNDQRIMMISGDNFQNGQSRTPASYYFSKYCQIWGWATWKRAWKYYDVHMKTWPEFKKNHLINLICSDPYEQQYWTYIFERVGAGLVDTWDYQWLYTCWTQNGLSIEPNVNLVSNLGYRPDATHTFGYGLADIRLRFPYAELPINEIDQIEHPLFIIKNTIADTYTFNYRYGGQKMREQNTLLGKILSKIKEQSLNTKHQIRQIKRYLSQLIIPSIK